MLDRRWMLLAFCVLPCAALLIAELMGRHDLENRATALRRENLGLEIKQLASSIDRQSYELEAAARALAEGDPFAEWVQESAKDAARESGRPNGKEFAKDAAKDPQITPRIDVKSAEQRGID